MARTVNALSFDLPTAYVYNPLDYAWEIHRQYLELAGGSKKKVVFLGMNPGPFGMAQTGVPFGEIPARARLDGSAGGGRKARTRASQASCGGLGLCQERGERKAPLGAFAERFGKAENFFEDHFVANYCPLVFMEEGGKNRTPDKLPASETKALEEACDAHLAQVADALEPEWLVGVGAFAQKKPKWPWREKT